MILVISGGLMILAVFALFGWLWEHDTASIATGARWFVPLWIAVALVNMWVGVPKAGYTVAQELPILLVAIGLPAAVAVDVAWQLKG